MALLYHADHLFDDQTRWIIADTASFFVIWDWIDILKRKFDLINNIFWSGFSKPPSYPSSSAKKKDWEKIEAEVLNQEEEKTEGDAALNQLFQKIYADGNDEIKKAMNKSFVSLRCFFFQKQLQFNLIQILTPRGDVIHN